jgi:hypothetical protein
MLESFPTNNPTTRKSAAWQNGRSEHECENADTFRADAEARMNEPTPDLVPPPIVIDASDRRLYIMIGSTTVDLPEHRHETKEAILRMGHMPVMMELGSAEWDSDAIKFSLVKVEKSQVYIGIFGLRYGYIPAKLVNEQQEKADHKPDCLGFRPKNEAVLY